MTTKKNESVDFDDYADRYESLLQEQLAFFSGDRGYFSQHKVDILSKLMPLEFSGRILDFGCGIGLTLPYLQQTFAGSQLYATDLSQKSLEHVAQKYPEVNVLTDDKLDTEQFDVIFVAGVFHHIPPAMRDSVMRRLAERLTPGGKLCVFEHNPYNPVTQRMVSTCPFDEDAVLLPKHETKKLFVDHGKLSVVQDGYCLFFPAKLKGFAPIEKVLKWLPLGGQYFVFGEK
jgi:SAM-dependent methyltransferase